jgi:hypothetical protein
MRKAEFGMKERASVPTARPDSSIPQSAFRNPHCPSDHSNQGFAAF